MRNTVPNISVHQQPQPANSPHQLSQIQASQTISQKISDYLNDNNRLITQSYVSQCNENYELAYQNLEKLVGRMISMMENADKNHKTRQVIYENRELLSDAQIKQYHELNQANLNKNMDQNLYLDYYLSSLPTKKCKLLTVERDIFFFLKTIKLFNIFYHFLLSEIEKKQGKKKVFWTEHEKGQFKEALQKFGKKDLKKISEYIGTKKPVQVRSHMQKYFKRLEKEIKQAQENQTTTPNNSDKKQDKKKIQEQELQIQEEIQSEKHQNEDQQLNQNLFNNQQQQQQQQNQLQQLKVEQHQEEIEEEK